MKLQPLKDKIVVQAIPRVKSSILEVVMSEKDNMGTVVAVGPEAAKHLKIGDFVRYGTMGNDEYLSYHEYIEDNVRYLVMSWKDITFCEDNQNAA